MPWDYALAGEINEDEQASAYEKVFAYWSTQTNFSGMYIWNWQVSVPSDELKKDYTPQGKKALEIIKESYRTKVIKVSELDLENVSTLKKSWHSKIFKLFKIKILGFKTFLANIY
jgi:hypothetical protein